MTETNLSPTDNFNSEPTNVWAFADPGERTLVYESLKNGKPRFGWSDDDEHNLRGPWSENHSQQMFLLQIKAGDWIVHVNCPDWGECVAVKVVGEYGFDAGLKCKYGVDFRHFIPIDPNSLTTFDRGDRNILPKVNLNPRRRYHRIYAVDEFLKSLDNLKNGTVKFKGNETRELFHLRNTTKELLSQITRLIHEIHKSKDIERFLANVFRRVPGV
jgi:hypothetical protein